MRFVEGPSVPKTTETFSPSKLRPSRANRAVEAAKEAPPVVEDEFGMIQVNVEIDATIEAVRIFRPFILVEYE